MVNEAHNQNNSSLKSFQYSIEEIDQIAIEHYVNHAKDIKKCPEKGC